jgi:glutamine amidotransferase-like uncharacterized protein
MTSQLAKARKKAFEFMGTSKSPLYYGYCYDCHLNTKKAKTCTVSKLKIGRKKYTRIRYYNDEICGDCGVQNSGIHHIGCDLEECPACGIQLISCECEHNWHVWDSPRMKEGLLEFKKLYQECLNEHPEVIEKIKKYPQYLDSYEINCTKCKKKLWNFESLVNYLPTQTTAKALDKGEEND